MSTAAETRAVAPRAAAAPGTGREVFWVFLRLGLTAFGGPVAHLGYFRSVVVQRHGWLAEPDFAALVALCQFLPGPASSQVGFAIGLKRAGWRGGLAAWTGFTAPSALALLVLAQLAGSVGAVGFSVLHGLKLAAVAIVAQAVWSMARALCPDRERASIAVLALGLVLLWPSSIAQLAAILCGAVAGAVVCRSAAGVPPLAPAEAPVSRRAGAVCLGLFGLGLALSFVPAAGFFGLFGAFYRAGALVFGGGHVVLPLLQDAVVRPGWVSDAAFLAGYGAAQAVPGPLFTVAAWLGTAAAGFSGGVVALVGIFLPGLLVVAGALPFWQTLQARPTARAAMAGVNAAVVGLLGAAFYAPVWTGTVRQPADVFAALAGFVLLVAWRAPPWLVVGLAAGAGLAEGRGIG